MFAPCVTGRTCALCEDKRQILLLKDQQATKFLSLMQYILDKVLLRNAKDNQLVHRLLVKLSEVSDILPHTISIEGVTLENTTPVARGGFADIYRGQYAKGDVALKRLIIKEGYDIQREFLREALIWQQLRHENILPFLGVALPASLGFKDISGPSRLLCMVSPWMQNGTICELRRLNGAQNINIPRRIIEISEGLAYLHSEGIIHGDLRGSNILVDDSWHVRLADFGLAFFNDSAITRTSNRRGSLRWMAPELLSPEFFELRFQRTQETDTYAFACVCIEIYAGAEPFAGVPESALFWQVIQNKLRPRRPTGKGVGEIEMPDSTWALIERCWTHEPKARMKMTDVLAGLKAAQS
ncbi:kinase-like domain-containing protein [Mycena pura]|uniref:Kinase-like domain-containing protein n=1 Tax=Mycena pura TaxID=153505 RepID=A0AAD6YNP8_9AGAR|nr:kinase-like domain-containing protein [Mycena pura]